MTTDENLRHARPSVMAVLATIEHRTQMAIAEAGVAEQDGYRPPRQERAAGRWDAYAHSAQLVGTLTESPLRGRLIALARDLADAGHEDTARRIREALEEGPG